MLNNFLVVSIIGILAITPMMAVGQTVQSSKWWRNPSISRNINLTSAEIDTLERQYRSHRLRIIDLRNALQKQRFELEYFFETEALDEGATLEQFKRLEKPGRTSQRNALSSCCR